MLRVQQLDMFLHLVESRSISATAEKMCLTQSAVTKSLKELEAHFSVTLFERTSRGLNITDSGKVMERYAESVVLGFESVISAIDICRLGASRPERIGCTPDAGHGFVVDLIVSTRNGSRTDGSVAQIVRVDKVDELLNDLRGGLLDYAIVHSSADLDMGTFAYVPLGAESMALAVRAGHPLACGVGAEAPDVGRLLSTGWVMPSPDSPTCRDLRRSLGDAGLPFPVDVVHVSCPSTIIQLVASLDLVAVMPANMVAFLERRGVVSGMRSPFALPSLPFGVAYLRRGAEEGQEAPAMIRRLLQLLDAHPCTLSGYNGA